MRLPALLASPALRAAAAFSLGGVGFAVANILLARTLPNESYGLVALALALFQIVAMLGPAGIDGLVLRHRWAPHPATLARGAAVASAVAVAAGIGAAWLYPETAASPGLLVLLCGGGTAAALAGIAASHYQAVERFRASLALSQAVNGIILLASLTVWLADVQDARAPLGLVALGVALLAVVGWASLLRRRRAAGAPPPPPRLEAGEALSFLGVRAASTAMLMMERLVIPRTLSLEDLATFAAAATLLGAPFRMLYLGVTYTLVPRMRSAGDADARRRVLRGEGLLALGATAALGATLWLVAPAVLDWLFPERYAIPRALVTAMVLTGGLRVAATLFTSSTTALAGTRGLAALSAAGWLAAGVSALGGVLGARLGLEGVVVGANLGWLVTGGVGLLLASPYLRRAGAGSPAAASAAATGEGGRSE